MTQQARRDHAPGTVARSTKRAPASMRVLLADDHNLVRVGIAGLLAEYDDVVIVAEAADGHEAVARFTELRPDVTLVDLKMPGLDGIATISRIRIVDANAKILVLTTFFSDDDIDRALRAGARGYLLKDSWPADLVAAIRDVHAGKTAIAPSVAAKLADRVVRKQLTVREHEVLVRVSEGKANKEIAGEFGVSEGTVKMHLTRVFEKLEVQSRTEAIAAAARRGLIRMD